MENHFTTKSLADMRLPGYPTTDRGWAKLIKTQGWEVEEFHGTRGRGGVRREYLPPPEVLALIKARVRDQLLVGERPRLPNAAARQASFPSIVQLSQGNSAFMELAIRLTIIIQVKLKLENIADEMLPRVTSLASQILLTGTHSDVQRCNQLLDSPSFVDFLFSTAYQSVAQEEDVKAVNTDR